MRLNAAIWDGAYAQSSNLRVKTPRGAGIVPEHLAACSGGTSCRFAAEAAARSSPGSVWCPGWAIAGLFVPFFAFLHFLCNFQADKNP